MLKKIFYMLLTVIIIALIGLAIYFLVIYYWESKAQPEAEREPEKVIYQDQDYGFVFYLPDSWRGYTKVAQTWQGYTNGEGGESVKTEGPMILLRHPFWTEEKPRQDIPVMVFTIQQWNDLRDQKFYIGAAPIGPRELGRNTTYVFVLPARYNYAFLPGYEEVEKLIESRALRAY